MARYERRVTRGVASAHQELAALRLSVAVLAAHARGRGVFSRVQTTINKREQLRTGKRAETKIQIDSPISMSRNGQSPDKSSGAAPTHPEGLIARHVPRAKTSPRNSTMLSTMPHSASSSMISEAEDSSESRRESSDSNLTRPGRASSLPMLQRSDTAQQLGFILKQVQYGLINRMLLFVPIAILVGSLCKPGPLVFILNFLAILPLAASSILIVVILTRNMGLWGGVIRAIFGNTMELAVSPK